MVIVLGKKGFSISLWSFKAYNDTASFFQKIFYIYRKVKYIYKDRSKAKAKKEAQKGKNSIPSVPPASVSSPGCYMIA